MTMAGANNVAALTAVKIKCVRNPIFSLQMGATCLGAAPTGGCPVLKREGSILAAACAAGQPDHAQRRNKDRRIMLRIEPLRRANDRRGNFGKDSRPAWPQGPRSERTG